MTLARAVVNEHEIDQDALRTITPLQLIGRIPPAGSRQKLSGHAVRARSISLLPFAGNGTAATCVIAKDSDRGPRRDFLYLLKNTAGGCAAGGANACPATAPAALADSPTPRALSRR